MKVLGCYDSKDYPRESCSSLFRFELESVRPEPHAPLEDYRYRPTHAKDHLLLVNPYRVLPYSMKANK